MVTGKEDRRALKNVTVCSKVMTRVWWEDRFTNGKLMVRCVIKKLRKRMLSQRLRWFGHVMKRDKKQLARIAGGMAVVG